VADDESCVTPAKNCDNSDGVGDEVANFHAGSPSDNALALQTAACAARLQYSTQWSSMAAAISRACASASSDCCCVGACTASVRASVSASVRVVISIVFLRGLVGEGRSPRWVMRVLTRITSCDDVADKVGLIDFDTYFLLRLD
jgi:hypothetical protein